MTDDVARADAVLTLQGTQQGQDRTDLGWSVEDLLIGPVRAVALRALDNLDADRLVVQANRGPAPDAGRNDLPHVPVLGHDEVRAGAWQLTSVWRVVREPVAGRRCGIGLCEVQDVPGGVESPAARAVVPQGVPRHLVLAPRREVDE